MADPEARVMMASGGRAGHRPDPGRQLVKNDLITQAYAAPAERHRLGTGDEARLRCPRRGRQSGVRAAAWAMGKVRREVDRSDLASALIFEEFYAEYVTLKSIPAEEPTSAAPAACDPRPRPRLRRRRGRIPSGRSTGKPRRAGTPGRQSVLNPEVFDVRR